MVIDFFESGLCFYCHMAKNELLDYAGFHSKTEALWQREDELLQGELGRILEKYPSVDHDDIVDSFAWDLHLNQYRYPDIHRSTLVVSVYILMEDQLNGLCATLAESMKTKLKLGDLYGTGVERACLYLSKVAGFNLGGLSKLPVIKDVGRLRNRLVHAGGVLPDDRNDRLNRFVEQMTGLRGEPGTRVIIDPNFIPYLVDEFVVFFEELDAEVQKFMQQPQFQTIDN